MSRLPITLALALLVAQTSAFSLQMRSDTSSFGATAGKASRRTFLSTTVSTTAAAVIGTSWIQPANAAPQIFNTPSGIKYAVLKPPKQESPPVKGDIVAIEYTGYLPNGAIFDGTHSEGKNKALVFELGGNAVIDGVNEMVSEMGVGEKRQVIVPPKLAFGDKGICVGEGSETECLVKPGTTLVYDIYLKKKAIPPP